VGKFAHISHNAELCIARHRLGILSISSTGYANLLHRDCIRIFSCTDFALLLSPFRLFGGPFESRHYSFRVEPTEENIHGNDNSPSIEKFERKEPSSSKKNAVSSMEYVFWLEI
jgi:hypothetical protein